MGAENGRGVEAEHRAEANGGGNTDMGVQTNRSVGEPGTQTGGSVEEVTAEKTRGLVDAKMGAERDGGFVPREGESRHTGRVDVQDHTDCVVDVGRGHGDGGQYRG